MWMNFLYRRKKHCERLQTVVFAIQIYAPYYVTAFGIMVSLMYYLYWFWYPPAVAMRSWYWFPRWLRWRTDSYFPERFDDKPVRKPPWASVGTAKYIYLSMRFWNAFSKTISDLLNITVVLFNSIGCSLCEWILKKHHCARLSFTWPRP